MAQILIFNSILFKGKSQTVQILNLRNSWGALHTCQVRWPPVSCVRWSYEFVSIHLAISVLPFLWLAGIHQTLQLWEMKPTETCEVQILKLVDVLLHYYFHGSSTEYNGHHDRNVVLKPQSCIDSRVAHTRWTETGMFRTDSRSKLRK